MRATDSSDERDLVVLGSPPPQRGDSPVASPTQFDIVVRSDGERKVIAVAGEIDCSTAPALHGTLHRLLAEGHHDLGVDLSSVTFMDGSVLTFLLTARRAVRARGGSSTILGHNRLLTRLLQATGLTGELDNTEREPVNVNVSRLSESNRRPSHYE